VEGAEHDVLVPGAGSLTMCALSNITMSGKALEVKGVDVLSTLSSGSATQSQL
jgi:hypothetical protein